MKNQKKPNLKEGVIRALKESMITYETYADKPLYVINQDMTAISHLELIDNTVIAISKSNEDLFTLRTEKHTGRSYVHASLAGKALHLCLKTPVLETIKPFPAHTFSPHIGVLLKVLKQQELNDLIVYPLNSYRDDAAEAWVSRMNACADLVRMETRTPEFKKVIQRAQRSCNKNFKGFMKYMRELFQKNGRVLGLRMDVGYKKVSNFDQAGADVPYEEAKRHRQAFIEEIRKRFNGGALLGYVWKFEYGLLKGYHSHLLIFLDGSKFREDVTIVKMLGEHWNSVISEGLGSYHNCNAKKSSYRFCGIGMLNHDDPQIWEGLEQIATYLTKPDYYVKLNMPGDDRALGKGGPPKLYAKKRGRPRESGETPD